MNFAKILQVMNEIEPKFTLKESNERQNHTHECVACYGLGFTSCPQCTGKAGGCWKCSGNGQINCSECKGTGAKSAKAIIGSSIGSSAASRVTGSSINTNESFGLDRDCFVCNGDGLVICKKCSGNGCQSCQHEGLIKCDACPEQVTEADNNINQQTDQNNSNNQASEVEAALDSGNDSGLQDSKDQSDEDCEFCGGTGEQFAECPAGCNGSTPGCKECDGLGYDKHEMVVCDDCAGTGKKPKKKLGENMKKNKSFKGKLTESLDSGFPHKPFDALLTDENKNGMVVMGVGGDPQEWVDGISKMLIKEGIAKSAPVFQDAFMLDGNVAGKDGRADLVLIFSPHAGISMGRLAIWRLHFGSASWIDDFITNYGHDYGTSSVLDSHFADDYNEYDDSIDHPETDGTTGEIWDHPLDRPRLGENVELDIVADGEHADDLLDMLKLSGINSASPATTDNALDTGDKEILIDDDVNVDSPETRQRNLMNTLRQSDLDTGGVDSPLSRVDNNSVHESSNTKISVNDIKLFLKSNGWISLGSKDSDNSGKEYTFKNGTELLMFTDPDDEGWTGWALGEITRKGKADYHASGNDSLRQTFNIIRKYAKRNVNEAWDKKMDTPKSKKGMFKGRTKASLKSELEKLKKNKNKTEALKTKEHELEFALRAKNKFGKIDEGREDDALDVVWGTSKNRTVGMKLLDWIFRIKGDTSIRYNAEVIMKRLQKLGFSEQEIYDIRDAVVAAFKASIQRNGVSDDKQSTISSNFGVYGMVNSMFYPELNNKINDDAKKIALIKLKKKGLFSSDDVPEITDNDNRKIDEGFDNNDDFTGQAPYELMYKTVSGKNTGHQGHKGIVADNDEEAIKKAHRWIEYINNLPGALKNGIRIELLFIQDMFPDFDNDDAPSEIWPKRTRGYWSKDKTKWGTEITDNDKNDFIENFGESRSSKNEMYHILKLSGLKENVETLGTTGTDVKKDEEDDQVYANEPNEQILDADTQLNAMSGGLNGPKNQINPFNKGDNAMTIAAEKVRESLQAKFTKFKMNEAENEKSKGYHVMSPSCQAGDCDKCNTKKYDCECDCHKKKSKIKEGFDMPSIKYSNNIDRHTTDGKQLTNAFVMTISTAWKGQEPYSEGKMAFRADSNVEAINIAKRKVANYNANSENKEFALVKIENQFANYGEEKVIYSADNINESAHNACQYCGKGKGFHGVKNGQKIPYKCPGFKPEKDKKSKIKDKIKKAQDKDKE